MDGGYFLPQRGCIFLQLPHCNAVIQNTALIDRQNFFLRWHGWFNFEYSLFHRFGFSFKYGTKSGNTLKLRYRVQRADNSCTLLCKRIWDERRMRNCWTSTWLFLNEEFRNTNNLWKPYLVKNEKCCIFFSFFPLFFPFPFNNKRVFSFSYTICNSHHNVSLH